MAYGAAMLKAELTPHLRMLKYLPLHAKTQFKTLLLSETDKHLRRSLELRRREDLIYAFAMTCVELLPLVAPLFLAHFLSQGVDTSAQQALCTECGICLGAANLTTLPCRHAFHLECITQWYATRSMGDPVARSSSSDSWTCPLCRQSIVGATPQTQL